MAMETLQVLSNHGQTLTAAVFLAVLLISLSRGLDGCCHGNSLELLWLAGRSLCQSVIQCCRLALFLSYGMWYHKGIANVERGLFMSGGKYSLKKLSKLCQFKKNERAVTDCPVFRRYVNRNYVAEFSTNSLWLQFLFDLEGCAHCHA